MPSAFIIRVQPQSFVELLYNESFWHSNENEDTLCLNFIEFFFLNIWFFWIYVKAACFKNLGAYMYKGLSGWIVMILCADSVTFQSFTSPWKSFSQEFCSWLKCIVLFKFPILLQSSVVLMSVWAFEQLPLTLHNTSPLSVSHWAGPHLWQVRMCHKALLIYGSQVRLLGQKIRVNGVRRVLLCDWCNGSCCSAPPGKPWRLTKVWEDLISGPGSFAD